MVVQQAPDDFELLDMMLDDAKKVPDIYQPTNYWEVYNKRIIPELYNRGLKDFRRRKNTMLHKFNANDLIMPHAYDIPGIIKKAIEKKPYAKPLGEFEASLVGNPEDIIEINGKNYTTSILRYYLNYVYCSKFMKFDSLGIMVELGSGSGKQIEVLRKLYPHMCFFVFEIVPQLYVCEQYLKTVFPDAVVSYKDTKHMDSLPEENSGKIYIMGNWKFPIINSFKVDLFWNSASFQEMEPNVVSNYLQYVNETRCHVFLRQEMGGKKIAQEKGRVGVKSPTTLDDYKKGLPEFQLVNLTVDNQLIPGTTTTEMNNSIWERFSL